MLKFSALALQRALLTQAVLGLCILAALCQPAMLSPAAAKSKFAAIAIDARSGKILYSRNADAHRYPASLTKIMTLYLLFEDLSAGKVKLSTKFKVSKRASKQAPSKLGLRAGRTIRVRDAIGALVTKSANDVAVVVAENLSGSVEAFASRMTLKARELGMTRTTFRNPSGLPNARQRTTARDMATLALRIHRDFPESYKYFNMRSYKYGKRRYRNHNRLLGRVSGVDGIKTGYTRASGFNLTSSARRNGKRVVAVVMGGKTGRSRNAYMTNLLNRMFRTKRLTRGKHLALVAGSPPGYTRPKPGRKLAVVQASNRSQKPPKPRAKPQSETVKLAGLAQSAAIDSLADAPGRKIASKDQARIGQSKTFVSVTVPPKHSEVAKTEADNSNKSAKADREPAEAESLATASLAPGKTPTPVGAKTTITELALPEAEIAQNVPAEPDQASDRKAEDAAQEDNEEQDLKAHLRSWNIQIGAFPTKEGAVSRLDIAKHSLKRSVAGKTPFTMPTKKNGKTLYRARISGFDKKSAKKACRTLSRKGLGCFALAPKI